MNEIETIKNIAWADRSESIVELAKALCKAQAEMGAAKKDSANPFYKTKYADLASVIEASRPALTNNGLSVLQEPGSKNDKLMMTTTLMHISGEYVRSSVEFPVPKLDPQGMGTSITYARRYAYQAIIGVPSEDDDGNAASQGTQAPRDANIQPREESRGEGNPPPILGDVILFGKHKGTRWDEVNTNYLEWLCTQKMSSTRTKAMMELHRRKQNEPPRTLAEDDIPWDHTEQNN